MFHAVVEGAARVRVPSARVVTRKMPVFYNPAMKFNRDVSVLLLKCLPDSGLRVADALAGSGVRGIRFLLELGRGKVDEILFNDASKSAVANIKSNLKLNRISRSKAVVSNDDASLFLLKNRPFDYVDVDPFGSPVPFLDAAVKSVSRKGILAVTATDTAALSGSAPIACMRKYWAVPVRNFMMHELGLRILIRRVQLSAASVERAMVPVYSYAREHYMRVFFRCANKLSEIDKVLRQHSFVSFCSSCLNFVVGSMAGKCSVCKKDSVSVAGPLWAGSLFDGKLASDIANVDSDKAGSSFLETIASEANVNAFGFYDTHDLCSAFGLAVPRVDAVIKCLHSSGFSASRTHFSGNGVRTDASVRDFVAAVRKCA